MQAIAKTAARTVGALQEAKHASSRTLIKMYMHSHGVTFAAPVWDPYQHKLIAALERVQKMALMMCAKKLVCKL